MHKETGVPRFSQNTTPKKRFPVVSQTPFSVCVALVLFLNNNNHLKEEYTENDSRFGLELTSALKVTNYVVDAMYCNNSLL